MRAKYMVPNNEKSEHANHLQACASYVDGTPVEIILKSHTLTKQQLYKILRKNNVATRRNTARPIPTPERNTRIVRSYEQGLTLAEIAREHGLTRQGVHIVIKKHANGKAGGAQVRSVQRKEGKEKLKAQKRALFCERTWGCSAACWEQLRAMDPALHKTPIGRFIQQRNNVEGTGGTWALTLGQWWAIWNGSGHYCDRGRTTGKYTMRPKAGCSVYAENQVEIVRI